MYKKYLYLILILLISGALSAQENSSSSSAAKTGTKARYAAPKLSASEKEAERMNELGLIQIKSKNFSVAEQTFLKALALDARNLGIVFNLASTYLVNKKEQEAITLLRQYIDKAPPDAGLYVRLGDAYFGSKNVETAVQAYEQAYKIDPQFPDLESKLGTIYLLLNRTADAEKFLESALSKTPGDLRLLTNISSVYLANSKPDKAITSAKKALQVKASKELYVTLGTAYEIKKDYKNALISFERARDLGDVRPEIVKKIDGLKKVSGNG